MDLTLFNRDHGFVEALIRGFRSTFLTDADYQAMMESESMEDLDLSLQETDFGSILQNPEDPAAPIDAKVVEPRIREKAAKEFQYLRAHSVEPLSTFMDYVTHEYMIQLVLDLLKLVAERQDDEDEEHFRAQVDRILHVTSHPLGRFDEATARAITAFGATDREIRDLFSTVLVETPVGPYFERYLSDEATAASLSGADVEAAIAETPVARLENGVMKIWLEEFHSFCMSLGGETAEQMDRILGARAAALAVNLTYNSMITEFGQAAVREEFRKRCYPSFGPLYPEGCDALAKVASEDGLLSALRPFASFVRLWHRAPTNEEGRKQIHAEFFKKDIYMLERAFDGQFHFGMFYAYVKLKEQEAKNLRWIAKQIVLRERDFGRLIFPFSTTNPLTPDATGEPE